jgi:hypothetical protein
MLSDRERETLCEIQHWFLIEDPGILRSFPLSSDAHQAIAIGGPLEA